nr:hypothetical protein [Notoacmeibacter sp. MSK16QG-6]
MTAKGRSIHHRESDPASKIGIPSTVGEEEGVLIAHWRYGTTGDSTVGSVQPFVGRNSDPVLAHNGQFLIPVRQDHSDSELFFHDLCKCRLRRDDQAFEALLRSHDGAFSIVCWLNGQLLAARDPHGLRPLFVGRLPGAIVVSSETTALEVVGCSDIAEIPAGHWASLDPARPPEFRSFGQSKIGFCAFEHIYFHSREGKLGGVPVWSWRNRLGAQLAREKPVNADIIVPVPDSGRDAAEGFAKELGLPINDAIRRNPLSARTFIANEASRSSKIACKYCFDEDALAGRNVCLVDDSVVRGATLRFLEGELRRLGVKAVHARIAAPKFRYPCFFGIDIPNKADLAVTEEPAETLSARFNLDSLEFLSVSGLHLALDFSRLCTGCFTSRYPVDDSKIRRNEARKEPAYA